MRNDRLQAQIAKLVKQPAKMIRIKREAESFLANLQTFIKSLPLVAKHDGLQLRCGTQILNHMDDTNNNNHSIWIVNISEGHKETKEWLTSCCFIGKFISLASLSYVIAKRMLSIVIIYFLLYF